jgi:hypothetical protein
MNGDGTVGFEEFVVFAKKRPDLFGRLEAQVGESVLSPNRSLGDFEQASTSIWSSSKRK